MAKQNRLFRDTFLYSIGPVTHRLISMLLLPYYSFSLEMQELGYYDLVITTSGIFIAIFTLKISDALYRWLFEHPSDTLGQTKAISNSFFVIILNITLIYILFRFIPSNGVIKDKYLVFGYVISAMLLIHVQQLLRGLGYIKMYTWLSLINSFILIACNCIFLMVFKLKLEGILSALIIANFLSLLIIFFSIDLLKFINYKALNMHDLASMIRYSVPLILNAVNWWLMGGFDRYIIAGYLGLKANGIYAIAVKYSAIIIIINSFFIPAWQDYVLRNKTSVDRNYYYNKFLNIYIVTQMSMVIFLTSISKFVIKGFIDVKFYDAWRYIPVLLIGSSFLTLTSFLGSFLLSKKNTINLFTTTIYGSVVNILLSLLLITRINIFAPCIGLTAGFMVTYLIRYFYLRKEFELRINYSPIFLLLIIYGLVLVGIFSSYITLTLISILLAVFTVIFMNKKIFRLIGIYLYI